MPVEGEHYWRDKDGLWVENVGPWAKEKLKILTDYVQISSGTRKKFSHCAFVDVFSGPGKLAGYAALFAAAGLRLERVISTRQPISILEASPI
jgi:hypothetical protein